MNLTPMDLGHHFIGDLIRHHAAKTDGIEHALQRISEGGRSIIVVDLRGQDTQYFQIQSLEDMAQYAKLTTTSNHELFVISTAKLEEILEFDRIHKLGLRASEQELMVKELLRLPDEEVAEHPIEALELPTRVLNVLKQNGIHTVEDIFDRIVNGALSLRNMGRKTHDELREALIRCGLIDPHAEGLVPYEQNGKLIIRISEDELLGKNVTA